MNRLFIRIAFFIAFFTLVNCSVNKQVVKTPVSNSKEIVFPELAVDEEIYIPRIKKDRRDFFPKTDRETFWVKIVFTIKCRLTKE